MNNYSNNDYAANKYVSGIVYRFADKTVEVTLEDYLHENPGKTEADFAELKALSDSIYFEQDRNDYRQTWKNVSIHGLEECGICTDPHLDVLVIDQAETAAKKSQRWEIARQALDTLTEVQRRRYILHVSYQLTIRKIAEIEGVGHTKVQKSIEAAEKKIKKFS